MPDDHQPQAIDLTKIELYCPTCETHKDARNRDGRDICCEECHTIIATIHPKTDSNIPSSPPWSPSHREEVISALWFIVAFVALDAGCPRWVFLTFFVKACLDSLTAIKCAVGEWRREGSRANAELSHRP